MKKLSLDKMTISKLINTQHIMGGSGSGMGGQTDIGDMTDDGIFN